ncbi:MAG: putative DNA binding domain-containing protein [Prevotella sp.]|uniref:RNA-binding domain-containing protein n=1 Tax=Prevotella sp. TaxID=59823 RepID=UPI002A273E4D|nr:RNA-binding domain-containing protein [Prevotella sp.]MDD7317333.1 putative DNA binding domain-containing protein [Prevotellaceae bacterium]MDY4019937.1 putative DNA binding domain-containing protein [Prevotella sp.]
MSETNRIEYKSGLTPELDIEKEVVAFLNYKEGGYIYIGVDKNGNTVGVDDVDDCMLRLKDRIKNNISPSAMGLFDISAEYRNGSSIVRVTVASGIEKPYFKSKYGMTPKGTFIRVGSSAEPMQQQHINRLFAMRTRNSIGRIISNRQDLSFEQLRIYYDERGKRLNENFKRSLEMLTEDGKLNYVAYLLADENSNSIKVAKYSSLDRCDLIENNEYGYCSLIKATKSVLAKLEIENKVAATITSTERNERPLWDRIALREAVVNAIVHNDYSFEVPPKFEIFPNRIEITSAGRLPELLSLEEFFNGISIPRNKELMRIYRDLELVESLGSGIPRILRAYGEDCFTFTDNFVRIVFPISKEIKKWGDKADIEAGVQVDVQLKQLIISIGNQNLSVEELLKVYKQVYKQVYKSRWYFKKKFIFPAMQEGWIDMLYPDKPNHPKQKYRLTKKGLQLFDIFKINN